MLDKLTIAGFDLYTIMPILALALLVTACIMAYRYKVTEFKHSHFSIFIEMLAPIGIIMVGISIYTDTIHLEIDKQMNKFEIYKDRVEQLYLKPLEVIIKSIDHITLTSNTRPKFYASLFYNNPKLYALAEQDQTPETVASELAEQHISMIILEAFEDFLNYKLVNDFEDIEWLATFITWAQSEYFQRHLLLLGYLYADETVAFTTLLIEYAKDIPCPNHDVKLYVSAATLMSKDLRLKAIHESMRNKKF